MLQCWKCHQKVSDVPTKVGFRSHCQQCDAALHACMGCRYYTPGKPNDCAIPGTEWVKDREAMNFCEDFAALISSAQKEVDRKQAKDGFNSLFKDENG